jgi:LmbE family N-acetylglucosaminyl deacetylase
MSTARLRLAVVTAHPDDEVLGFGGVLARTAAEGVETYLLTATSGQGGRYFGHPVGADQHPGRAALGELRERELRAAAAALKVGDVRLLGYEDQQLDRVPFADAVTAIARYLRDVRPHVVLTFDPAGAYGHPDHIAISQFTAAAIVAAADPAFEPRAAGDRTAPHVVSKFYYLAWGEETWAAYQSAVKKLVVTVDGVERQATPWPSWALTTVLDTRPWWPVVWRAVSCHASQVAAYEPLKTLTPAEHEILWGWQSFYRVFSLVNGGRQRESDLFEGLRERNNSIVDIR